ncbi:MAG: cysteine hydrolase family protein [Thermomicrobiales bacterium]
MSNGTALVVIDVQNAIIDGEDPAYRRDETLAVISGLIEQARAAKTPVIYVQHEEQQYAPLNRGADGWQIHPKVAPLPGERIVQKQACDSFYGTPLRSELDALGITHLVVAGMQTDYCVDTACRRALSLDYDVTLVADGHTTFDTEFLTAAQIIAHHNATLAGIPHPTREIGVKPASEIVFEATKRAAA